jgi:DNA-binding protein HU-beta
MLHGCQTLPSTPVHKEIAVNRRELVVAVANHTGMDPKSVDAALKGVTDVLTAVVSKGEVVAISGFAKFARVDRKARMGRNPATGETIRIKASRKARITPLKAFKDVVLGVAPAPKIGAAAKAAAPAKKTTARKPAAKKTTARKPAARKTTTARKPAARKTTTARKPAAKKTTARKPAAKKTTARKPAARR